MKDESTPLPDDADLHAYVDGQLDAGRRAAVESRLAVDADAARRVREWSEQRDALRGLHADLLDEPIPEHLLHAGELLHHRSSRMARWQRWGGMAAAVLISFALGWGGNMQWQANVAGVAASPSASAFARQAVVAHAVFSPEVRHPVEVDAKQQEHLVQWLSKRLNRPLKLPNLAATGYELVGGRLLSGGGGPRAQFMYQNSNGERITLYVGAIDGAGGKGMGETAFRFTSEAGVQSFYWVDQGYGYALSGKLPRQGLLVLAEAVYKQL
jgi:anti-sigma factor RsiW